MLHKLTSFFIIFIFYVCFNSNSQTISCTTFDTTNSPLPINDVNTIIIDKNNNKWFGTAYGGLVKYDGVNWTIYNMSNSPIPSNYINSIAVDSLNHLWIATGDGTNNGLAYFDGIIWKIYDDTSTPVAFGNTSAVAIDNMGNVWAYSMWCGLYELIKIQGDSLTVYNSSNSGIPFSWIRDIEVDKTNTLWLAGYDKGLIKFDGLNWTVYNPENSSIPDSLAQCIAIDDNGEIWVGMYGGLAKFDGTNWTVFNNTETNAISIDKKGNIWIGYDGQGIAKYDGASWTNCYTFNSGISGDFVQDIKIDFNNVVWIGIFRKGISALKENSNGVNDIINNYSCSIFPNPFSTETIIHSDNIFQNVSLTIHNSYGQQIKIIENISGQEITLHRDNLPSGLYFIRLYKDTQTITTKKIVISN